MKVCACCFNDEEIREFINSEGKETAYCDCCGQNSNVIDLTELSDFFTDLLGLFVKNDNGISLINRIQKDWNIFSSDSCADFILSAIINNDKTIPRLCQERVSYLPEIEEWFSIWENLKKEVRENKRYFHDFENFGWDIYYIRKDYRIKKDSTLFRARITPEGQKKLKAKEMGCPPREKATAGRANPLGIPYLYLCDNEETTYYEVRAVYLDKVSVGEFVTLRDLEIVDFSRVINLFYAYSEGLQDLTDIVKHKFLLDEINKDLSKPLRRFDTEIDYVPTQLICEYCKLYGADGVRFNSSLHEGGKNIVLFNGADAKCVKVFSREIESVEITAR